MKKKMIFCLALVISFCCSSSVMAISDAQRNSIKYNCDTIKANLKTVQRLDAKARVFLGGHYENILTKFITPLNVRLVENHISSAELIDNQNNFADTKNLFASDFINYQQGLEELIAMDCRSNPEGFYDKLTIVRKKRKTVEQDTLRLKQLLSEQMNLVRETTGRVE